MSMHKVGWRISGMPMQRITELCKLRPDIGKELRKRGRAKCLGEVSTKTATVVQELPWIINHVNTTLSHLITGHHPGEKGALRITDERSRQFHKIYGLLSRESKSIVKQSTLQYIATPYDLPINEFNWLDRISSIYKFYSISTYISKEYTDYYNLPPDKHYSEEKDDGIYGNYSKYMIAHMFALDLSVIAALCDQERIPISFVLNFKEFCPIYSWDADLDYATSCFMLLLDDRKEVPFNVCMRLAGKEGIISD